MADPRFRRPMDPGRADVPPIRIFAPGPALARRFEIREVLGTSPWGAVYRALDLSRSVEVAVKVLRADSLPDGVVQRLREDAAAAADENPRAVRLLDVARLGSSLVVVSELVPGETLATRLESGPLPVAEAIGLAIEMLEALRLLHTRGILHRGLKPSNVHLLPGGGLKLSDTGLPRRWEPAEERREMAAGLRMALTYVSPEEALGRRLETRSDLYAFGVVLFEMLAGQVPLLGNSPMGTLMAHVREQPPDVRELRPQVPVHLARCVTRLLEKDPEDRYGSAEAVLSDLRAGRARLRRRRFSRPLLIGTAAAALTALVAFVAPDLGSPHVVQLVIDSRTGARAIDERGEVLWRQPRLNSPESADLVVGRWGDRIAAVLAGKPGDPSPHVVTYLDRTTGAVLGRAALPAPAGAERFEVERVQALDSDGDGADELLVRFRRPGGGESYTAYLVPGGGARVLFASAGPHVFCGAADLDGDGRIEFFFAGPSPALEGFDGIAAVRRPSPEELVGDRARPFAITPDREDTRAAGRASGLLWYALVPPLARPSRVRIDSRHSVVAVDRGDGPPVLIDSTGFSVTDRSPAAAPVRAAARRRAYEELRAARAGGPDAAVLALARAQALAFQAGDRALAEVVSKKRVRALLEAGRPAEAARAVLRLSSPGSL